MASIYKRKNKDGKTCGWRAVIRATGYPIVCKQFERKQEGEDWRLQLSNKSDRVNLSLRDIKSSEHFLN